MPTAGALDRLVLEYLKVQGHKKAADELRQNLGVVEGGEQPSSQVSLTGAASMPKKLQENILFWGVERGRAGVGEAFGLFLEWALQSLDDYRLELLRVAWPLFVETFTTLTRAGGEAQAFLDQWSPIFAPTHGDQLGELSRVTSSAVLDALVKESEFLKCRCDSSSLPPAPQ